MAKKKAIPSIPPVPNDVPVSSRVFLQAIRDALITRFGLGKNTLDSSPTLRELVDNGVLNVATDINGQPSENWTVVTDTLDPADTPNTNTTLPWVETFSDNNLSRVQADWGGIADIGGEESVINETGTPPSMGSSYVWQLGNNSGDDEVSRAYDRAYAIPIEDNVLYKMTWHVRRLSGSGTMYLGVAGLAGNKSTYVNTAGSNSLGTQHYFCLNGTTFGDTAWHTQTAWFMRTGAAASISGGTSSPPVPDILHTDAKFVVPLFYTNYNNAAGSSQIAYVSIERDTLAQLGTNVTNEAGELLSDIDVRNDQLVLKALGALNANPTFNFTRRNQNGNLAPAGWWKTGGDSSASEIIYESDATRDVLSIPATTATMAATNAAFRVNPGTTYEIAMLIKDGVGASTAADIRVRELDTELGSGEYAIGSTGSLTYPESSAIVVGTRVYTPSGSTDISLTTSYAVKTFEYIPTSTAKWASVTIASGGRNVLVDWCTVRSKSTIGATSGTDLKNSGGTVIGDNDVLNSAVVTSAGTVWQWIQDSSGAWPAGNPTHDSVVTFYRSGSSIATHTVRFSLTTSTGVATAASLSSTGETTTYAESGDPTAGTGGVITCTIKHTASNCIETAVLSTATFTPAAGGGGGTGK